MSVFVSTLVLILLFALSAFFSGSETILFSLTGAQRARIRARNPAADRRIARCVDDSAALLSTLLVGNTFVNFAIATIGYNLFAAQFPSWGGFVAVPAMTALLLLFGEITPKRIALHAAERLAPVCAPLLLFWRTVLTPFNWAIAFASRAFAKSLTRERRALSDAELVSVLESAAEQGEFAARDAEMIEGVLRLSELHANDEMTPRVDIQGVDSELDWEAQVRAARHPFLPVFRRTKDAVESVLDARTGERQPPLYVPEQMTLDDLLLAFRRERRQVAIVLDEYGGTAGLITMSDVLEVIVGPSVFAHPGDEPAIVPKGRNAWEIDGRVSLDEINRELGIELEAEDADRFSGWIIAHAERIPNVRDVIVTDGCRVTVLNRRHNRITRARLEVLAYPEVDTDAELLQETDAAVEKTAEDGETKIIAGDRADGEVRR